MGETYFSQTKLKYLIITIPLSRTTLNHAQNYLQSLVHLPPKPPVDHDTKR